MRISAHGIEVDLPDGWDGKIFRRPEGDPTLHASNFPLPAQDGDFGTGAVDAMGSDGVFLVLTEYDPALAGRGLFEPDGPPRSLRPADLHPRSLLKTRPGKSGAQRFFTASGRAFCLYVVIGSFPTPGTLVARANELIGSLSIQPA